MAWTVHRERILLVSGGRALLMQAAHPRALAGFLGHSSYEEDEWGRLWRTARSMITAIFGPPADVEAVRRRVGALHDSVPGADDPELLLWVHATFVESAVVAFEAFVRRLTDREKDVYNEEMKAVAELFGLPADAVPPTFGGLRGHVAAMIDSGTVAVTEEARDLARETVLGPPLPLRLRPGWPMVNLMTAGLLPPPIRAGYGLTWTPLHAALFEAARTATKRALLPLAPGSVRHYTPRPG